MNNQQEKLCVFAAKTSYSEIPWRVRGLGEPPPDATLARQAWKQSAMPEALDGVQQVCGSTHFPDEVLQQHADCFLFQPRRV